MKKSFSYITSFAAVMALFLSAVSCDLTVPTEEPHRAGEPDVEGCYGVYFPTQAAAGYHVYDPLQDTKAVFTVKRDNSNGSIVVPVKATVSEENIFNVGKLVFDDGQDETNLEVTFNEAKEGKEYSLSISIEDPQYASRYSVNPVSIDFSLMRVSYVDFPGTITAYDEMFKDSFTLKIRYYEVNNIRYCETYEEQTPNFIQDDSPSQGGYWGTGVDKHLKFNWYLKENNTVGNALVELPTQNTGRLEDDLGAYLYYHDYYYNYTDATVGGSNDLGTWLDFAAKYGESYPLGYYDGNGMFRFTVCTKIGSTGYWYGAKSLTLISDAFTRVDYGIKKIAAGLSENGVLPISIVTGADVASIKYAVYEGVLTDGQAKSKASGIIDGKEVPENVKSVTVDPDEEATTIGISGLETGEYTFVAVTCDSEGKTHEVYDYVTFCYVAEGSEVPVVVKCGLAVTDKYAKEGYTSENSLEFYVYGEDLTAVKIGLFSQVQMSDSKKCVEALMESKEVSAKVLESINDGVYVDVASGLTPGTGYYLVVWATNGYEETIIASDMATTSGDPLPIYMKYTEDSLKEDFLASKSEELFGTYNAYAVDVLYGSSPLREYYAKVTIGDSEIPDSEPDKYGHIDEYVTMSGLFSYWVQKGNIGSDDITFNFYNGLLYWIPDQELPEGPGGYTGGLYLGDASQNAWGYNANIALLGIPVADGYYAFIANTAYNAQGFNFDGICLLAKQNGQGVSWFEKIYDLLLVDPAKDDNGVAPAAVEARIAAVKKTVSNFKPNYVELPEFSRIRIVEEALKAAGMTNLFQNAGIKNAEFESSSVKFNSTKITSKSMKADRSQPVKVPARAF